MSDWQSRPLTDRQKTYAALDAYVLPKCFDVLKQQLGPEATQQLVQQHTKTLSRVSDTSKHSLASAKLTWHHAAFVVASKQP
jgi:ribonuclease D